jgi:hypothetical protein
VEALVPRTGKLTARVNDKAGFVLNRLQYVLLREAVNLVEEGIGTPSRLTVERLPAHRGEKQPMTTAPYTGETCPDVELVPPVAR